MIDRQFFKELFGHYTNLPMIEVRGLSPSSRSQYFFHTIDMMVPFLEAMIETQMVKPFDLYFGVAPRDEKSGTKEAISQCGVVWVDVDAKQVGSKDEAYKTFNPSNSGILKPTFIVDSGNGYHGYWVLDKPISDCLRIEQINRGLAERLRADKTHNINRILRVPGSLNMKDPERPKLCRVIERSDLIFDIACFDKIAEEGKELLGDCSTTLSKGIFANIMPKDIDVELEEKIGEKWTRLIEFGIEGDYEGHYKGDRSSLDLAVCLKLMQIGLSDEEVIGILINPYHGISSKTLEKYGPARMNYLSCTISKARKYNLSVT